MWATGISHHAWQNNMSCSTAYPRAFSECPCQQADASIQVTRQTYVYIDKSNRIHREKYERIPVCERHETCQVCLCTARIYQPDILRNHAAWWIDSQFKAAGVCCTCEFLHYPCLPNTILMLVIAALNKEGKCSEVHRTLLCMGPKDCWMQCMMSLQSSWTSHWHHRIEFACSLCKRELVLNMQCANYCRCFNILSELGSHCHRRLRCRLDTIKQSTQ